MVRVLHYIGLLKYGGSQSFVMEIYRKVDKTKIQFDFVTFPNEKEGFYQEILSMGGRVFESPRYNGKNHFEFLNWWKQFFIEHPEYKVFHAHVRSVATLCISIAKRNGCFTIAHSHSTSNGRGIVSVIKKILQFPLRYQADYLFSCSEEAGKWLFGNGVERRDNYQIVKNAIDGSRFCYDSEKRYKVREELGIQNYFVVGHVGRMTEPKNHDFLINIFKEVLTKRDDAVLLLVGDGELRKKIDNKVREENIENKVIFLGSRGNTEDYYQAMDVFVLPSLWEGLGIVVIEAQTSGLPCVISNRIPEDVDLKLGLVSRLGVEQSAHEWADEIGNCKTQIRRQYLNELCDAGYDVFENAKKMQMFYLDIFNKHIEKMDGRY